MILRKPLGVDARTRYEIRTAAKDHSCAAYPRDADIIRQGDRYLICTEFPGGASGYSDATGKPVHMRLCLACSPTWVQELVADSAAATVEVVAPVVPVPPARLPWDHPDADPVADIFAMVDDLMSGKLDARMEAHWRELEAKR